jgi:hypothetical protein
LSNHLTLISADAVLLSFLYPPRTLLYIPIDEVSKISLFYEKNARENHSGIQK